MGTTENPEGITNMMCKYLNRKLYREFSQFAGYTNAELCELEGVKEPVWVMRLYIGKNTNYAIYESISRNLYIYYGPLKPKTFIDLGQTYRRRRVKRGRIYHEIGRIWTNRHQQVCLKWQRTL